MEQKEGDVQKYVFRIVGLSRSGNHAIINWIINQLQGDYLFLNCTEPKYNPYDTARPLDKEGYTYRTNLYNFELNREKKGNFSKKKYLLFSHEDCFLGSLNKKEERKKIAGWVGSSEVQKDILIIRDPFNLFASRAKAGLLLGNIADHTTRPISEKVLCRIYKQHAREFLGENNNLRNKVIINFNTWSSNENYRLKVAKALNIPFSDAGYREVTTVAGGSSFDGTNLSGMAHKMKVNERWKNYAKDDNYWSLFDQELLEFSRKIFGNTPPAQFFEERNRK
ncbi:hypothetical protein APR41_10440 [Salegentibacter salinarum]|uniref:Sulfotransferase domain-containing protein n=1 Tax=Salegentibacter salinarum TaxID=447422 RepID=A0A2N0TNA3_9FLAO|nr:hypothetical protein [Salegentibacter salinarum]PKD16196.1 hypothetical protein APR41_10440 [Salegentibacter salinarum]SKB68041.1 hypothetical protein SAMN05660903_02016 [Salegentibacter salinarum]